LALAVLVEVAQLLHLFVGCPVLTRERGDLGERQATRAVSALAWPESVGLGGTDGKVPVDRRLAGAGGLSWFHAEVSGLW
jgi:hypothetical protein